MDLTHANHQHYLTLTSNYLYTWLLDLYVICFIILNTLAYLKMIKSCDKRSEYNGHPALYSYTQ